MLISRLSRADAGVSLVEVLIAMVIVAFGLLGLAALQSKAQLVELEAYQRAQAVVLVDDMAHRMRINYANAAAYVTASPLGTGDGGADDCTGAAVGLAMDQCEWGAALRGVAEQEGDVNLGAMIGARGCVEVVQASNPATGVCQAGVYRVTVAWQGLHPTSAPALDCARDEYGDDALRRAVAQQVVIGLPSCF